MEFIETTIFTKQLRACLSDHDYGRLQEVLVVNPEAGVLIRNSGGLRKIRWSVAGAGKRGGTRVIYYWTKDDGQILMLTVYRKNEQDNLTPKQLKSLRKIVEGF